MEYEVVIGLEVHAQLLTDTKIFCGCSNKFGETPNENTCPVCTGQPGSLPVLNKKVVEYAIKAGLATNCTINKKSIFARKNYFYPDLPKGYQISQYELPICEHGKITINVNGKEKEVGITRIHMEEDAGKLSHEGIDKNSSYVDFNRTGTPLIEIVSEPDIRSPEEAAEYLKHLRNTVVYLEICDGNMEEGSFRCDANISLRPKGSEKFGTKTELKNMNSFRNVQKALEYEIKRQKEVLEEGGTIIQETRLWNADRGITESMRSKEEAHDYRYFPDPDLLPLIIDDEWIKEIKKGLPELPYEKESRFINEYKISKEDAEVLVSSKKLADFFEQTVKLCNEPSVASNWIRVELLGSLNYEGKTIDECKLTPEHMGNLIKLIKNGSISGKIAKNVFREMYSSLKMPDIIVKEKGLVQISDESQLKNIIQEIIEKSQTQVEQYRSGKTKVFGFFVGQVMKATKGQANPQIVNKILKKLLDT
jgi:aspartyl-tRNA(Asn)/glutamyl-tRNA(Gln) amidotransferase subunit B